MKHFILLILVSIHIGIVAQEACVEKSIYGIQMGIYPFSIYNETRLTNSIAIRAEIGTTLQYASTIYGQDEWRVGVDFVLEPKFYYNLKRRQKKNKKIDGNSANYFTLHMAYSPSAYLGNEDFNNGSIYRILPMYGVRRKIGKHFNFEMAFGLGYYREDKEASIWHGNNTLESPIRRERITWHESGTTYGLRLSVGYLF